MNNDINIVSINNISFKLITQTKNITACIVEEENKESNIINFQGYTDQVAIKLYKDEDVDARIDIRRTGEIFVYENKELVATVIPRITLEDDSLIAFNTSLNEAEDTILFTLESNEEKEIKAIVEFAVTSNNNVYHIGAVNTTDYWYDTAQKEVFKYDINSKTRTSIVSFNDFMSVPYLAPKMLSPNYLFFGEGVSNGSIYKINNNSLSLYKESDYNYLTALPNDLFIGIKIPNDNTTIYELVSFSSSLEFTVHDSYTLTQEYPSSIYYRIPMVTSCDSLGKNINICFFTGAVMDNNTDFYYSAVIDLNNPSFNFSKSQKGIAILKEDRLGPRVYYSFSNNSLYCGTEYLNSYIYPIYSQNEFTTLFATSNFYSQIRKAYIVCRTDGSKLFGEYINNSVNATAYTVTFSNKEGNIYEYIDMSVPKILQHLNQENTIPLDKSIFYESETEGLVLNVSSRAIFKGPKGLYKKRLLSWTATSVENAIPGSCKFYNISSSTQYYNGLSTTDNILLDMGQYGIGFPSKNNLFILEKIDSMPVTVFLGTNRIVKKTISVKKELDVIREIVKKTETRCRRIYRKIAVTGKATIYTLRKVNRGKVFNFDTRLISYNYFRVRVDSERNTIQRVIRTIKTIRQIVEGKEAVFKWIDTKMIITNNHRSKGPFLRKVAINVEANINNTLRPVIWIYKINDGKPIYLDVIRIIHKSINKKIKTLRRIERICDYVTSIKTVRCITNFSIFNINTIRNKVKTFVTKAYLDRVISKKLYLSNFLLRRVSIGAKDGVLIKRLVSNKDSKIINTLRANCNYISANPSLIRRIIFNNSIFIKALTRRNVVKNTDFLIDSNRETINKILIKPNTNRKVIMNYISGYAFTKRKGVNSKDKSIDINRRVIIDKIISIDLERLATIFKWFRSNLARIVGIRSIKSLDVNRITANDIESIAITERKVSRDYINLKYCERVVVNNPIILTDVNRGVVKKNEICIDMIKKVAVRYIYLNSTERVALQTIEVVSGTNREINAYVEVKVDTERQVENSKAATTLTSIFVLRKGLLYEIDSNYEYVDNNL